MVNPTAQNPLQKSKKEQKWTLHFCGADSKVIILDGQTLYGSSSTLPISKKTEKRERGKAEKQRGLDNIQDETSTSV